MRQTEQLECDVLVVGGGINGAGIARDAAGRGLSVILCEQDDLGAHTSSASSKLIHGGLRYLQYYEFGLVRKALREREVLLRSAPHLIRELRFVMPHVRGLRPAWMLRCGLFLYDRLAKRELLRASRQLDLTLHPAGVPLAPGLNRGYIYSDACVDDARLVVLNAVAAAEHGARILTRTRLAAVAARDKRWHAELRAGDGARIDVRAKSLVNASGAWAMKLHAMADGPKQRPLRLVKGSHIVVPKLFGHDDAYIFQHADGRIVFAIPYQEEYTLIGTTDIDYDGDPREVRISEPEVDYLCGLSNTYFKNKIAPADVIWSYAGVRPLVDNGAGSAQALTRDYEIVTDRRAAPLLSVFGGKITTYRTLAENAVDSLAGMMEVPGKAWTAHACLPGGDVLGAGATNDSVRHFTRFATSLCARYHWLPPALVRRYAHTYGTRANRMLDGCRQLSDMGAEVAPQLYERELEYLMDVEWAATAEDVLWRRTKLGLHAPSSAAAAVDTWMRLRGHQVAPGYRTARA
ncbi:homodimeric glycerol 3-phosphate dehydrogenase (quinone) [Pseudoduganella namucuonensis]|uniref:Glycerol-3-phosphate dehydrogenase n=2 Tax=Pseudoduganella namucuonensis TaxID=1035707 RepID=A0A1I7IYA5_9BURK|nr:homodimeric glycerol 3-phosphate dehydrogenase (quinone) [Pseudoduganella namucuonensis]